MKRQIKKKGKKKNERGSNNKHEHFPKKEKEKATLINKGENRRIITQQIHSLLTLLSKLGRKLFFFKRWIRGENSSNQFSPLTFSLLFSLPLYHFTSNPTYQGSKSLLISLTILEVPFNLFSFIWKFCFIIKLKLPFLLLLKLFFF